MCNGQANALPNTHTVITATFIIQTSSPSIVIVAPESTTTSKLNSTTSSASSTTSAKPISSISTTAPPVTSAITRASSRPTTSTPASKFTAQAASSQTATPAASALSTPQIAGVAVASVSAVVLAFAAVFLFACYRRRKQDRQPRDSDMLPFQLDPHSNINSEYGLHGADRYPDMGIGPGGTANGVAARIAPSVPARLHTHNPNIFSRRSLKPARKSLFSRRSLAPDTIGLAFSEESEAPEPKQPSRRTSRLLPDKPILTLTVPEGGRKVGMGKRASRMLSTLSTGTQFEDDDDRADTAIISSNPWGQNSDEILNNKTGKWQSISSGQPTMRAVPKSSEEQFHHWRPGQGSVSSIGPGYYIQPLNVGRQVSNFSQPRQTNPSHHADETLLQIPAHIRPITSASSDYDGVGGDDLDRAASVQYKARGVAKKVYNEVGPYDAHKSSGSLTSFETTGSPTSPVEPRTAGTTDLSPVVESPASGKSPVNYPRIPGRLSATIRLVPPPQPNFTNAKPWRQPELDAQRERAASQNSNAGAQAFFASMQNIPQAQPFVTMRDIPQHQTRTQQPSGPRQLFPPPKSPLRNTPQYGSLSDPFHDPASNNFPTPPQIQVSGPVLRSGSPFSQTSKSSSTSTLAARRRGENAAALNLDDNVKSSKWRVVNPDVIETTTVPGWRPQLGNGTLDENGQALPGTPGWKPKLTPTRRGNDLFLSVQ